MLTQIDFSFGYGNGYELTQKLTNMKFYYLTVFLLIINITIKAQQDNLYKHVDIFLEECALKKTKNIKCAFIDIGQTKVVSNSKTIELYIKKTDIYNVLELINYIENKYLKVINYGVRKGVIKIFYKLLLSKNFKNYEEYKQKLTLICLNNSTLGTLGFMRKYDKSYFNNMSIKRLFDILNNIHSKEEVSIYLLGYCYTKSPSDTTNNKFLAKFYLKESKKVDLSVKSWCDSINNDCIKKALNPDISSFHPRISYNVVALIGNAYLKEFSPKLEEMYNNKDFYYLHETIELVLARLQYKDYEQKKIEKIRLKTYEDFSEITNTISKLRYIGTKDAIFELSYFLLNKSKAYCSCENRKLEYKEYGYYMLYQFCIFMENFPIKTCKFYDYSKIPVKVSIDDYCFCIQTDNLPADVLEKAFEWMENNKENYIMRDYFYLKL